MADSLTITTIVLGELVFVLALSTTLLAILLRRESRQLRRLTTLYKKTKDALAAERKRRPSKRRLPGADEDREDPGDYLTRVKTEASERYHSITGATVPRLSPEQPFNAKIAALRYLFGDAEERALRKARASGDPWVLLEKQLYDVARWIVDRESTGPNRQRNNQVHLLQQRVDKLKGFEKLSRDLKRKLSLSQNRREELEQLHRENQETIRKLQRVNHILSLSQESGKSTGDLKKALNQILHPETEAPLAAPHNHRRLNNIEHIAADNQRLHGDLVRGLRGYAEDYPSSHGDSLESTVKRLEAELYRSEQNVRALKERREQQTTMDAGAERNETMDNIEDTLKVIHTGVSDSIQALGNSLKSDASGSPYSLAEIQQLRFNNSRQRNLIVDLEGEMRHLKEQLPTSDDASDDASDAQHRELDRMGNLVKECEHCILALESEVDMLYNQLQEQSTRPEPPAEPARKEQLDTELNAMEERMEQALERAERDAILSEFALASLHAQSLEEVARVLIGSLKRAGLTAGFWLHSNLGNAEYFPGKHFTEREQLLTRETQITGDVAYLNEGALFVGQHIHLLLKPSEGREESLSDAEPLIQALVSLAGERIAATTLAGQQQRRHHTLENWSQSTHNTLLNMEIRYAYQAEEAQRLIEGLTEQVKRVAEVLSANEATQTVLDNALEECRTRLRGLFTEDEALENGFDQLLSEVEALPKTLH